MRPLTSSDPTEEVTYDGYGFGQLGPEPEAHLPREQHPFALPGDGQDVYAIAVCHRRPRRPRALRIVPDDLPAIAGPDWGEVPEGLDLDDPDAVLAHVCGT